MRFFNKRFSQETTLKTIDNPQEQQEIETNLIQEETPLDTAEISPNNPMSTHLMSKFYRFQTSSEPPESFYENEAWAPKEEGIGLFRKHRMKNVD